VDIGTGPQIDYALTDLQELVSRLSRNTSEIYLHSMDPDRDGPAGPPDRISSTAMDRHTGASYSPDGRYIAYFEINNPPAIGANARPVLAILDRTTHRSRRVPVSMAFLGYARPRWTRDSRAVSVFGRDTADPARTGYYKIDLLTGAVTPIVLLTNWRGTHIADWGFNDDHFMYPDANRGLVERDLLTGAEVALLGPDTFAGWFAKAPDGRIAFVRRNSNPAVLEVRQRDGSLSVLLTAADGLELRAEAWSDDGKYIFFTLANAESTGSVFRIASEGGPAVDLHVRWAENPNPVAVSPDGRELAVTEASVDHELRFLPLRLPN
jgi:Tol biopolymer transport system component